MTIRSRNPLLAAAAALLWLLAGTSAPAAAAILVLVPGVKGDSKIKGFEGWFVANSFSFGVERELPESGAKAGTADVNIGVGELQQVTISKPLDAASAQLAQLAMNGSSPGNVEIAFVEMAQDGKQIVYLRYTLDRCFVKSWSTSGDADDRPTEEVAFYYNKIAFNYALPAGGNVGAGWDRVTNKPFSVTPAPSAPAR
jgi:type VI secretion system secreted protein Hcp